MTPIILPTSFCERLRSSLFFLICSPKVWGSKSKGFFLKALRQIRTYGKRATRPCPCGHLGDPGGRCHCTLEQVQRYRARISGPLLDRIDMHIEVPKLPKGSLRAEASDKIETSRAVRERVEAARNRQMQRGNKPNAALKNKQVEKFCRLSDSDQRLLEQAIERLGLSARAYHRILKVARTIADLAGSEDINTAHLTEAISYRRLDRALN